MDITQFKINVEKSMKANNIKKSVKETLQKESDQRQGLIYSTQKFYEPIIKKPLQSLKENADENQDKMIKQLKENQKAITTGLKNIVESNQDIYTLNNELPFSA